MFVLPPTNHLAKGRSHSSTLFHFSNQCSSDAMPDQNCSGFSAARFRMDSYSSEVFMCAFEANAGSGGKILCSFNDDSMFVSAIGTDFLSCFAEVYCNKNKKAAEITPRPRFRRNLVLLGKAVMLVVHRDVLLPLFRNIVFREDRGDGAGRFASATIDAFTRMNVQHGGGFELRFVLFRVDTIHWTRIHARRVLRVYAWFAND